MNGLCIVILMIFFPKLTPIEESLITLYQYKTILIKLKYFNKFLKGQKALKGNISSFVQNHDAPIVLIDSLPTSLKSFLGIYNLRT